MISIGLLSEVLNLVNIKGIYEESDYTYDLCDRELMFGERLIVFRTVGYNKYMIINIYELAHKCKVWAYNVKNTILTSWKDRDCCYCEIDDGSSMSFSAQTEAEAIFQACDWTLNNR